MLPHSFVRHKLKSGVTERRDDLLNERTRLLNRLHMLL